MVFSVSVLGNDIPVDKLVKLDSISGAVIEQINAAGGADRVCQQCTFVNIHGIGTFRCGLFNLSTQHLIYSLMSVPNPYDLLSFV